jgi:hypothetical protein
MSQLIVPPLENDGAWPSLGGQVGSWMENRLAFGPGDLLGEPYRLDAEDWAFLERMYQVNPPQHAGPCRFVNHRCAIGGICGRRRFDTVVLMLRKGSKKSERLASVAAVELAPDGPVRCDGFRREGRVWVPIGRPVTSPAVFILAFAKEQAEDTSWDAMRAMVGRGSAGDDLDVWEDRIVRRDGDGEAKALATAPDSRDGGKTTFQGKEEGHRWTFPRQKEAHQTTRANLSKRPIAEPWEMHATTAYAPGEGSVIENIHDSVGKLKGEDLRTSRTFLFHRWADDKIEIRTEDGKLDRKSVIRAIDDASGPEIRKWSEAGPIADREFFGVDVDIAYAERVWLNRIHPTGSQAFDTDVFKKLGEGEPPELAADAPTVLAWSGSRYGDQAGLIAVDVETGYQWVVWETTKPADAGDDWEASEDDAEAAVADAVAELNVWLFYVNPDRWETAAAKWSSEYGSDVVKAFRAGGLTEMSRAVRTYAAAIKGKQFKHSGDAALVASVGASRKKYLTGMRDDEGRPAFVIGKERQDSPHPVNLAQAAVIGWRARADAIKAGALDVQEMKAV